MIGIPHPLIYGYLALYYLVLAVLLVVPCLIKQWKRYVIYVSCVSLLFVAHWFLAGIEDSLLLDPLRFAHAMGVALGFVRHLDPQRIVSRLGGLGAMLFVFIGVPTGYQYGKVLLFKLTLPSSIAVADTIHVDQGFKKSCGMVLFQIGSQTQQTIQTNSPADLLSLWRMSDPKYYEWGVTPYQLAGNGAESKDRWLDGVFCAHIDEGLRQEVADAVSSNKAFYARAQNSGVVVIPERNWVAYSYAK